MTNIRYNAVVTEYGSFENQGKQCVHRLSFHWHVNAEYHQLVRLSMDHAMATRRYSQSWFDVISVEASHDNR